MASNGFLALTQMIQAEGNFPNRDSSAPTSGIVMGMIRIFGGNFNSFREPLSDGQLVDIRLNTALFSILGATYGGDGRSVFGLPDLAGNIIVGEGLTPDGSFVLEGEQLGGSYNLTQANLPSSAGGASVPVAEYQPSLGLKYLIQVTGTFESGLQMMGLVVPFAGNFETAGFMECDGRLLQIGEYDLLYAIMGTTYGGDGETTFALPDLRGRSVVGTSLTVPIGTKNDNELVIQTSNMPVAMGGSGQSPLTGNPSLALNYMIAAQGLFPSTDGRFDGQTPMLGEIYAYAGVAIPRGFYPADGRLLPIASNQALFSLYGTTYGGDGRTTFALPDLRDRSVMGYDDNHPRGSVTQAQPISMSDIPALNYQATDNSENLYGSDFADTIDGRGGNDTIRANGGDDLLFGGLGNDTVDGGLGIDTIDYTGAPGSVTVTLTGNAGLSGGSATGAWGNDTLSNIENIRGGASRDFLTGNDADNRMDGGASNDVLTGGKGNDIYITDHSEDEIFENFNEGNDSVFSSVIYALSENIENLTLTGTGATSGYGNSGANNITGNIAINHIGGGDGDDRMDGAGGGDYMFGGAGNDIYVVRNSGDVVLEYAAEGNDSVQSFVTYALSAEVEDISLMGVAAINGFGNGLNNRLNGNTAVNRLYGDAGDDALDGLGGGDYLIGGAGNDTYTIRSSSDIVIENADEGFDSVLSGVTISLGPNIESILLTGAGAINAFANASNNTLTGNGATNRLFGYGGNDSLDGAGGGDYLAGGDGNDTYSIRSAGDVIVENASEGQDFVVTTISFTLSANVEDLQLQGSANIDGSGNGSANMLFGNLGTNRLFGYDGNDSLDGGGGGDYLVGGAGNDTYTIRNAGDVVIEYAGEGNDTVFSSLTFALGSEIENLNLTGAANINGFGNSSDNALAGNTGDNRLYGNDGNDRLAGGTGQDVLFGGAGLDIFVLENTSAGRDMILDFETAFDKIEVSTSLFGNLAAAPLSGLQFVSNTDGQASSGGDATTRFIYNRISGALWFDADGSDAGAAVQIATVYSAPNAPASGLAASHISVVA